MTRQGSLPMTGRNSEAGDANVLLYRPAKAGNPAGRCKWIAMPQLPVGRGCMSETRDAKAIKVTVIASKQGIGLRDFKYDIRFSG